MLNLTSEQIDRVRVNFGLVARDYNDETYLPSGCSATFIQANDSYGVKFYRGREVALRSYYWNKILSDKGFAPKVWDFGSVTLMNDKSNDTFCRKSTSETFYYFHQQAATTIRSIYGFRRGDWEKLIQRQNDRIRDTCGIFNNDSHTNNWGLIGAKLMMIDVGDLGYKPTPDSDVKFIY